MIQFILNNQTIKTSFAPGSTVLDFVRYHKRLVGTKIGCREGDCGACTILAGNIENEKLVYRSMTCCLMPLANAQGKHIVTVEGINGKELSAVQQALVDMNGTQCGFCTPGFVMSLTGFVLNQNESSYDDAIKSIDGNICRCTGYKSIEKAVKILSDGLVDKPKTNTEEWLVKNNFIPAYFIDIKKRLLHLKKEIENHSPQTNGSLIIGGGTDLVVQKHGQIKKAAIKNFFDNWDLKQIALENNKCAIGGSVTVTEFSESPII
ncbi:MAG TPA: 2Fe-2S iron-sulfur cluster-binding protein, partial [Chitinophagaceae bacterium]|nr:2Fe-2S iron-sulfur cluster-binding protein [Chitinophagaceae bacterium]